MEVSSRMRSESKQLELLGGRSTNVLISPTGGQRAIEDEDFPFEKLSQIAEAESWRKEINRPTYHIHKWWAHRLGSVFRAIAIAAFAPAGSDVLDLFYRRTRIPGQIVFDPFMGSGTTVGEVAKLGGRAIGRDINPVAHFLVQNALASHDRQAILATFRAIDEDVGNLIRHHYKTILSDGTSVDVLGFFWVKTLVCPECSEDVDLFSSYVFARHAYPSRHPTARAVCPQCGGVNQVRYDSKEEECGTCGESFNPQAGPAQGKNARCSSCQHVFPIVQRVRESEAPPRHRLYAKLVLMPDGTKQYLPATEEDQARYQAAEEELDRRGNPFPVVEIKAGYNTNQALGYNYRHWHNMFNARQLLCLSILADRIRAIENPDLKSLFTCLFSGALEFNNQFASYKGEGTGAVRHMFAHHILKPERTPLEANLWGTPKSSGSFSTMFEGRIRRALDYAEDPFEISPPEGGRKSVKVFGLSERLGCDLAEGYRDFESGKPVYLSCGDSSCTDLPDQSVDAVITDPPFFDNVHYSQLADFFHVWQRHILGTVGQRESETTRADGEVQNGDAAAFTSRLESVWQETRRVLKDGGLLVFTYHHSRPDGWRAVLEALMDTGFVITATHPVKAEMSVAMPKHQAKEPIDLDIIIVCRKRLASARPQQVVDWLKAAEHQVARLKTAGRGLSRNDVLVILMAQFLRYLSYGDSAQESIRLLDESMDEVNRQVGCLHGTEQLEVRGKAA
ncbi:MAG: DNA methyltransferase [Gammaproteobacteria bacterium]|nr:DNA methyltransferase [Gammaproteobacteria bacterium]